jgi:hypothetical protein
MEKKKSRILFIEDDEYSREASVRHQQEHQTNNAGSDKLDDQPTFCVAIGCIPSVLRLYVMRQVFCPQSTQKRRYHHAEIQSGPTSRLDCGPYNLCHGSTTADAYTGPATIDPRNRNLQADPNLSGQS